MLNFRKLFNSLPVKLIVAISVLMVASGLLSALIFVNYEKTIRLRSLTTHAAFINKLVEKSLQQGMIAAQREEIQKAIESLGSAEEVGQLAVLDREGRVAYGTYGSEGTEGSAPRAVFADKDRALKALTKEGSKPEVIRTSGGATVLNVYSPIKNQPACFNARCHYHAKETEALGVLVTSIDASSIDEAGRQMLGTILVLGGLSLATISAILFLIIYKFVTRPVTLIEQGIERLSSGDFSHPIELETNDEMGLLARRFNSMSYDLNRYKTRLENWAEELQREVEKKAAEIKAAQDQLSNAEKLASLGRLSAGVAHELNSPMTGIVTFAHLLKQRTPEANKEDHEDLDTIISQAERCTKIIKGLLGFSRRKGTEKDAADINEIIESTISILRNQAAFREVDVVMDFDKHLPKAVVDSNQIQQVMINLVGNAADAMNNKGRITIRTSKAVHDSAEHVEIEVADTGPGIMADHLSKIFEPFFTTKEVGKGTGLGLPVSYGIVKRHGGDIRVQSTLGKGTTFLVRLPISGGTGEEA